MDANFDVANLAQRFQTIPTARGPGHGFARGRRLAFDSQTRLRLPAALRKAAKRLSPLLGAQLSYPVKPKQEFPALHPRLLESQNRE